MLHSLCGAAAKLFVEVPRTHTDTHSRKTAPNDTTYSIHKIGIFVLLT